MLDHCKTQADFTYLGRMHVTSIQRVRYRYCMAKILSFDNQQLINRHVDCSDTMETIDDHSIHPLRRLWPGYYVRHEQFEYGILVDIIQNSVTSNNGHVLIFGKEIGDKFDYWCQQPAVYSAGLDDLKRVVMDLPWRSSRLPHYNWTDDKHIDHVVKLWKQRQELTTAQYHIDYRKTILTHLDCVLLPPICKMVVAYLLLVDR